ncbi:MAG: PQQ-dependent sugar dehydrogenase [Sphingomonadaceae bacterium]|nr:PQQ-dependent sugar dehydrogenase [Sphingomonadaceae bacterium]
MRKIMLCSAALAALVACGGTAATSAQDNGAAVSRVEAAEAFAVEELDRFAEPWAMTFLPDGRLLVTEKAGTLRIRASDGATIEVAGAPQVDYGGQGGLGDVVLHPRFAENGLVYLSYADAGEEDLRGAAVARARLVEEGGAARLERLEVIWRQVPKYDGHGHYGHRIAFGPDGFLYISSGDRQEFNPAQLMASNLGKVVRLNDDGSVPADNPYASESDPIARQVWTLGHRNPLGIAFAPDGRLWEIEMGPQGGDELNLIERGANYGYPIVSNGDHYDGTRIPDHSTRPEFRAPAAWWTPVISPGDMIFYTGGLFADWRGNILVAGMSAEAIVRVAIEGDSAREIERIAMGQRIREIEQAPDGSIWVLEDQEEAGGAGGRLLRLTPAR